VTLEKTSGDNPYVTLLALLCHNFCFNCNLKIAEFQFGIFLTVVF